MKTIKTIMLALAMIAGATVSAQNESIKPVFEKEGDLIKATYFHSEGVVSQEGTFKDGELHGTWVSYDTEGNKIAMGHYTEGIKTGKWFFWNEDNLSEVDYANNRLAQVLTWNKSTLTSSK